MVLSSLADAIVSVARIRKFLLAEELSETPRIDPSQGMAVLLDGDFEWEVVRGVEGAPEQQQKEDDRGKEFKPLMEDRKKKKDKARRQKGETSTPSEDVLPVTVESAISEDVPSAVEEKPFDLKGLRLEIPKGAFVAIVGRVGSGKVCNRVLLQYTCDV